ncbi:MAG: hypothetical protein PGN34_17050 [Methylobacterium frigidaeris]
MQGPVVIDTNLLLLLVVGSADRRYIDGHKRSSGHYTAEDFDTVVQIVGLFPEIVLLPNVLTEVSSFARHPDRPARQQVQAKFRQLVERAPEVDIASRLGVGRDEFMNLGLIRNPEDCFRIPYQPARRSFAPHA